MGLTSHDLKQYHVFLASPGDVDDERKLVRQFFERYNRTIAQLWGVRFEVVDWENYSSVGVGRPQELITQQTLERYKDSLALVIGIMAQRFGSPTGKAESGTEEEFRWALAHHRQHGFPEIKWFFKRIERFIAPPDPDAITAAAEQWQKVRAFREQLKAIPMYFAEYSEPGGFKDTFENDLGRWLADHERPWIAEAPQHEPQHLPGVGVPDSYYETLERDFRRLDISGIDNDKSFEIPLSEIYVRLRVMFDEELQNNPSQVTDAEAIDIQTALLRYSKLVIVGDPGSGKSTFLKYVALMLSRSVLQNNPAIALEKLCIQEPLPVPAFVSCWDLSDFLRERGDAQLPALLDFVAERVTKQGFQIAATELESLLNAGNCCLLFDGLDEVPTDAGRAVVSRLLEDCVKEFPKNRYVVTSRVRAYTGDTILKGEFARCDIQQFDADDRAQFLKNWVALLFKTSTEQVLTEGTEPNREFQSLTSGIENNDRIRPLAVNPLLLTVIAIVHWNRKRLPEQRVDLYDECVDVLLGQRKEAEQVQSRRKADAFNEQAEQRQSEERPWLRKRFAEIALRILEGEGNREEASKADVIKLLAPRFLDRGARTQEEAEIQAARFLKNQELRSGLLVSRREQSYRFVHLTFQEYLASWHLSNLGFEQALHVIEPRLRHQRWFEPLQLLGGEWAKQSDEKLDRYLRWLLERQGESIIERAPVVALCANIVKDTSGVAELTPETRSKFQGAVKDTLDAFKPASGVPVVTQLEILEALGQLGAAVKSHLIDATKSGLFQVRSRAIQMLLPHLSDDDLFGMGHLLNDRSKEPIKTYLRCLLSRDPQRTTHWLIQRERFPGKATDGFTEILGEFAEKLPADLFHKVVRSVFTKGTSHSYSNWFSETYSYWPSRATLLTRIEDEVLLRASALKDREPGVQVKALLRIVAQQKDDPESWQLVRESATRASDSGVRTHALDLLAGQRKDDPETWQLIRESAAKDDSYFTRIHALDLLAGQRKDDPETWQLIRESAAADPDGTLRTRALSLLAEEQKDDQKTWQLVRESMTKDQANYVRLHALSLLRDWRKDDPETWESIRELATRDDNGYVRRAAFSVLIQSHFLKQKAKHLFPHIHQGLNHKWRPDLDPKKPVTNKRVKQEAQQLNLDTAVIRKFYEELADGVRAHFDFQLILEWRD